MKQILGLSALLFLISCYQPERNCADFKTGTFEFEYELNGKKIKSTFIRTDSIEIDYYENKTDTNSIRWLNNCEFIAAKLNPLNDAEKKAIHMKILTTAKDSYTFEYSLVGDQKNKQRGTAKKINP